MGKKRRAGDDTTLGERRDAAPRHPAVGEGEERAAAVQQPADGIVNHGLKGFEPGGERDARQPLPKAAQHIVQPFAACRCRLQCRRQRRSEPFGAAFEIAHHFGQGFRLLPIFRDRSFTRHRTCLSDSNWSFKYLN